MRLVNVQRNYAKSFTALNPKVSKDDSLESGNFIILNSILLQRQSNRSQLEVCLKCLLFFLPKCIGYPEEKLPLNVNSIK
jgi:hypothetical protein